MRTSRRGLFGWGIGAAALAPAILLRAKKVTIDLSSPPKTRPDSVNPAGAVFDRGKHLLLSGDMADPGVIEVALILDGYKYDRRHTWKDIKPHMVGEPQPVPVVQRVGVFQPTEQIITWPRLNGPGNVIGSVVLAKPRRRTEAIAWLSNGPTTLNGADVCMQFHPEGIFSI